MEIENGNIVINAKNDGIHVNDTLAIGGGNITVTAEGDGIQSDEIVDITDGKISITTKGEVAVSINDRRGRGQTETENTETGDVSSKGIKADWMLDISGGEIEINSTDHAIHSASDINIYGGKITITSANKGISGHGNIVINDGDIDILKATEGIETKQIMTINGGDINITASDDGLNAGGGSGMMFGRGMENSDGETEFGKQMPFGGERPQMPDGEMPQRPDGQMGEMRGNIGMRGGQTGENMPQFPDMDGEFPQMPDGEMPQMPGGEMSNFLMNFGTSTEISDERHIQINGGNIYIYAKNDGIDSNGSIVIAGGTVIVEGPPLANGAEMGLVSYQAARCLQRAV